MTNNTTNLIKSVFQVSAWPEDEETFSEWVDASKNQKDKPKEEKLEYPFDIMEYIVDGIEDGQSLTAIHEKIVQFQTSEEINKRSVFSFNDNVVNKSNKIKSYFKNRMIMRRLKNRHMSAFMQGLEEILETPQAIKPSHVKIAVKLPDFYREGTETEAIFKESVSLLQKASWSEIDDTFTFAGSVNRHSKNKNSVRHYFKNSDGNLLMIECINGSGEHRLLEFLVNSIPSVLIRGNAKVMPQPGYEDFLIYQEFEGVPEDQRMVAMATVTKLLVENFVANVKLKDRK